MMKKIIFIAFLFASITSTFIFSDVAFSNAFTVKKIHVSGLKHISLGTTLNSLSVKEGDQMDSLQTSTVIKELYDTGFFSDVRVSVLAGGVLNIFIVERIVIGKIDITGSSKISKKQVQEMLKSADFIEGRVFNNSTMKEIEQSLLKQYTGMGYYDADVQVSAKEGSDHKMFIKIQVKEGEVVKIKGIYITGNKAFKESKLLKNFELSPSSFWKFTFLTHADRYSREKLEGDLEKLKSFYLDNGYLRFDVVATDVSLSKNKQEIYISISVKEGNIYKLSGYSLIGNYAGKKSEASNLVKIQKDSIFSRQALVENKLAVEKLLGDNGYAMASVRITPEIDDKNKSVFVKFICEPGTIHYIRNINISGNMKTDEFVLRREMRQQEATAFSASKIEESKRRLANLGYLSDINFKLEQVQVPYQKNALDLNCKVKEESSAGATFNIGYSDADGLLYGVSVNEQNFLGKGKGVMAQFNNSKSSKVFGIGYFDPYFTENNVSMKFDAYAQFQQPGRVSITSYTTDIYGANFKFGIPLSDYKRLSFGYGYEFTNITSDANSFIPKEFVKSYGAKFHEAKLFSGLVYNNLDRYMFPTKGLVQSIDAELYLPLTKDSLKFYKANYSINWFKSLTEKFVFSSRAELGYGNGFGSTDSLPFYKNYYAGGMDTVRGFDAYSLGPKDNRGNSSGGNILTDASVAIIFPNPIGESVRSSVFVDCGSIHTTRFEIKNLRASTGLQIEWRSPLGMLRFSLAKPLRKLPSDRARLFDFAIGTSF